MNDKIINANCVAHERWDRAVGKSRGRSGQGEQAGAGSRGWWGASERRGLTTLEEEEQFTEETSGPRACQVPGPPGQRPQGRRQPGRPKGQQGASVCGEGRGGGLQEVEVVSSVCGGHVTCVRGTCPQRQRPAGGV